MTQRNLKRRRQCKAWSKDAERDAMMMARIEYGKGNQFFP
jgi:hypothetical protein